MKSEDIRWHQRLTNFRRALAQLQAAVALAATRELTELEQQGTIHAFEFTHELAWKVMKGYFFWQGGSRSPVRAMRRVRRLRLDLLSTARRGWR